MTEQKGLIELRLNSSLNPEIYKWLIKNFIINCSYFTVLVFFFFNKNYFTILT